MKLHFWRLSFWNLIPVSIILGAISEKRPADEWFTNLLDGKLVDEAKSEFSRSAAARFAAAFFTYLFTTKISAHINNLYGRYLHQRVVKVLQVVKKQAEKINNERKSYVDCVKLAFQKLDVEKFSYLLKESIISLFYQSDLYKATKLGFAKEYIIVSGMTEILYVTTKSILDPQVQKLAIEVTKERNMVDKVFDFFKRIFKGEDSKFIEMIDKIPEAHQVAKISQVSEADKSSPVKYLMKVLKSPMTSVKETYNDIKKALEFAKKKPKAAKAILYAGISKLFINTIARILTSILYVTDKVYLAILVQVIFKIGASLFIDADVLRCFKEVSNKGKKGA